MGSLSVIPELMGRSVWVHTPQDHPNSSSEALDQYELQFDLVPP